MEKNKKIIIGLIIAVIFLAAVATVLNMSNNNVSTDGLIDSGGVQTGLTASQDYRGAENKMSFSIPSETMMALPNAASDAVSSDNKIIKIGSLNLKVNDADSAAQKITQIAKSNEGEVFSSNFYQSGKNIKSGTIEVKVPVDKFEKAFSEIKEVATLVVRESISGQNVTMEYADLQIQLKNKQAEEQSFLNILDRAGKIDDVLAVTREVARVRGEIERLQGQIKFMDSQTDKSTISVSLTEDAAITFSDKWRPWQVVKETFNTLFKDIQGAINFVIVLVIRIIPIAIFYILILGILYWAGKKIYLKIKG